MATDPTRRFADRAANYSRYRPTYPPAVLDILHADAGLQKSATIADIGSGTGISAALFLNAGHRVIGVEPNDEMRSASEELLANQANFRCVRGTAEATTLPAASVDVVVAAQAFHWFDPTKTRREFARVVKPHGLAVLLWNTRRIDSTEFLREYEQLLVEYGTDYDQVNHQNIDAKAVACFFAPDAVQFRSTPNEQRFDLAGLMGRLLSSSYVPPPSDPRHQPMLTALQDMFARRNENGIVRIEYDTEIYFGQIAHLGSQTKTA